MLFGTTGQTPTACITATCACCPTVCDPGATYVAGPNSSDTATGLRPLSIQTIRVPDSVGLPALVRCCGGCDDGLAINGERVSRFGETPPDFQVSNRTFEAGIWNDNGPWGCTITFCFSQVSLP